MENDANKDGSAPSAPRSHHPYPRARTHDQGGRGGGRGDRGRGGTQQHRGGPRVPAQAHVRTGTYTHPQAHVAVGHRLHVQTLPTVVLGAPGPLLPGMAPMAPHMSAPQFHQPHMPPQHHQHRGGHRGGHSDHHNQPPRHEHPQLRRQWVNVGPKRDGNDIDRSFTVMSYNMLADSLLFENRELYTHCQFAHLRWVYRRPNLVRELVRREPDIMCLQEVDMWDHFNHDLTKQGYKGHYLARTGDKNDGLAIFYKEDRFRLVAYHEISFRLSQSNDTTMNRDNVAQAAIFERIDPENDSGQTGEGETGQKDSRPDPNNCVCVTNTHLLFNPKRGDIKLCQLAMLFAEVDHLLSKHWPDSKLPQVGSADGQSGKSIGKQAVEGKNGVGCGVVMCGDYNLLPESLLYGFVTGGEIQLAKANRTTMSAQVRFSDPYVYQRFGRSTEPPPAHLTITSYPPPELKKLTLECKWQNEGETIDATTETSKGPESGAESEGMVTDSPAVSEGTSNGKKVQNRNVRQPARTPASDLVVRHHMQLSSAYGHIDANGGEEVTTWHQSMQATVDYLFYSKQKLRVVSRLELVPGPVLSRFNGLPNAFLSSDHQALMARFAPL